VLVNVAVALVVEGRASNVREGYALGAEALDRGAAAARFERLKEASRAA
jgi:anthranilate phosphoribosyltransferase